MNWVQVRHQTSQSLKINDEIIKPTKKLTLDTLNDFLSIYYGTLLYFEIGTVKMCVSDVAWEGS